MVWYWVPGTPVPSRGIMRVISVRTTPSRPSRCGPETLEEHTKLEINCDLSPGRADIETGARRGLIMQDHHARLAGVAIGNHRSQIVWLDAPDGSRTGWKCRLDCTRSNMRTDRSER